MIWLVALVGILGLMVGYIVAWTCAGRNVFGIKSNRTKSLIELNRQLEDELESTKMKIKHQVAEIECHQVESRTDSLTGLANRRAFDLELHRLFSQRQRKGTSFSLILVDIDHFKEFNDDYGHPFGDTMLKSVANGLTNIVREMDFTARYGGEEFAILLPATTLEEGVSAAERLRSQLEKTIVETENGSVNVTVSVGLAEITESEIVDGLIQRVDNALYSAKRAGRNLVYVHDGHSCKPSPLAHNLKRKLQS